MLKKYINKKFWLVFEIKIYTTDGKIIIMYFQANDYIDEDEFLHIYIKNLEIIKNTSYYHILLFYIKIKI